MINIRRLKELASEDEHLRWRWLVVICFFYASGCLLIYFGVVGAAFDFLGSRKWKLEPEPDVFSNLIESAWVLLRPLLAAMICWVILSFPVMAAFGLWVQLSDFLRWLYIRCRR